MKFKTYPKYKDYGIEWIGEIPEDWEVKKLKFTSDVYISNVDKKIHSNEDIVFLCNYIDVYKNEFITSNLEFMQSTASFEQIKKLALSKDDVIITKDSETIEEIAIPALVVEDLENIVCGYHLSLIRTHKEKLLGRYLFRLFQSKQFSEQFSINANGVTRFGISTYPIKNILILLPPWQEQKSIAEYLNIEILKINTLIEKDKRLIELLKEKRISLINHAVTKGLDPNAKMKDSGIDWIGEIPEDWEVKKLKFASDVFISNVDKKIHSDEDNILLCNYINVYNNEFITSNLEFMQSTASFEQIKKLSISKDDVIITKDSETIEEIAVPALVVDDLKNIVCGYHLSLIRSYKKELLGQYLFRLFQSKKFSEQFSIKADGVTRFGISTYPIKNILILLPSKKEQKAIAEYLNKQTLKINKTIQKIEEKINLLEEYKKSLIHHTVTGKIDVREVV